MTRELDIEGLCIRPERPADVAAITRVTEAAFRPVAHGERTEQFVVLALRRAGALSVSLVAEHAGRVVGHVAFSPVRISDGSSGWYGLGPVSVLPELQDRGVGSALVDAGLAALRAGGAAGCVVLGEPRYYGRFGFRSGIGCTYAGVPPELFQSLSFSRAPAVGDVRYHSAFDATS